MLSAICSLVVFSFLNVEISSRNVVNRLDNNNAVTNEESVRNLRNSIENLQAVKTIDFSFECPFTEQWQRIGDPCPKICDKKSSTIYARRIDRPKDKGGDDEIKLGAECYLRIESRKCHPKLCIKEIDGAFDTGSKLSMIRSKRQLARRGDVVAYSPNPDMYDYGAQENPQAGDAPAPPAPDDKAEPPAAGGDAAPPAAGGDAAPPAAGGDAAPPEAGGDSAPPASGGDEPPPSPGETDGSAGGEEAEDTTTTQAETPPPTETPEIEVTDEATGGGGSVTNRPGGTRMRRTSIIFSIVGVLLGIVVLISVAIVLIMVRRRKRRKLQASMSRSAAPKK